jgi:hypothetical protein
MIAIVSIIALPIVRTFMEYSHPIGRAIGMGLIVACSRASVLLTFT